MKDLFLAVTVVLVVGVCLNPSVLVADEIDDLFDAVLDGGPGETDTPAEERHEVRGYLLLCGGWGSDGSEMQEAKREVDREFRERGTRDRWTIDVENWSEDSGDDEITPLLPYQDAIERGADLGRMLNAGGYDVIVLVGHSLGGHYIEEISSQLNLEEKFVYSVFLSAWVVDGYKGELGEHSSFAVHYRDTRVNDMLFGFLPFVLKALAGTTDSFLSACWNVDVSEYDPSDVKKGYRETHDWPREWFARSRDPDIGRGMGIPLLPRLDAPGESIEADPPENDDEVYNGSPFARGGPRINLHGARIEGGRVIPPSIEVIVEEEVDDLFNHVLDAEENGEGGVE